MGGEQPHDPFGTNVDFISQAPAADTLAGLHAQASRAHTSADRRQAINDLIELQRQEQEMHGPALFCETGHQQYLGRVSIMHATQENLLQALGSEFGDIYTTDNTQGTLF